MRKPFNGDFPLTQGFGVNPQDYVKFGLLGHDGLDYGLPTGTEVVSPHAGRVVETSFDAAGYGYYIKVETETGGSVLAHLSQIDVQPGFTVVEGQHLGLSGSTGNATGPHLHWGYYPIPRDRKNGFDGFIDQSSLIDLLQKYTYTYKVGDILEPSILLPTGPMPGKEDVNYGHIGPHFPAKVIGFANGYYNIDQAEIGGGTGWVSASLVDLTSPFIQPEQTVQTYTEAQYNSLQLERDNALKSAKDVNDQLIEANKVLTAFTAMGYEKSDDITNALNKKDETILGLNKQIQQVLERNQILAKMVQDKDKEDATAIDEGIKAIQEAAELKKNMSEISKNLGTKPAIYDMMRSIFNLKDMADKFMSAMQKQKTETKEPQFDGVDWFMKFFGFRKEVSQ